MGITRFQFLRIELKPVRMVSAGGNLKRFQHRVLYDESCWVRTACKHAPPKNSLLLAVPQGPVSPSHLRFMRPRVAQKNIELLCCEQLRNGNLGRGQNWAREGGGMAIASVIYWNGLRNWLSLTIGSLSLSVCGNGARYISTPVH